MIILGWVVDTKKGTLSLSSKRKEKILSLLDPPPPHTRCRMAVKLLEHITGKLYYMHLAVPGNI